MPRWNPAEKKRIVAEVKAIFDSRLTGITMREVERQVGGSHHIIGRLFHSLRLDGKIAAHGSGHHTTWSRTSSPWGKDSGRREGIGDGRQRVIRRLFKSPPVPAATTLLERHWGRGTGVPCVVCGLMHRTRFCGTILSGDTLSPA